MENHVEFVLKSVSSFEKLRIGKHELTRYDKVPLVCPKSETEVGERLVLLGICSQGWAMLTHYRAGLDWDLVWAQSLGWVSP